MEIQFPFEVLNLPQADLKIRTQNNSYEIYDILRHRYVNLSPEEWVRQNFVHFLISHKHYPQCLLGNEISIQVNKSIRRCDTILYKKNNLSPLLIIEYKAPHIKIDNEVFIQILSYNSILHAPFLIVSNGLSHYICKINYSTMKYSFLNEIPDYMNLKI